MHKPKLSLICAMDKNRLIGNNNQLPWHLPADLALFKQNTLGKPVLMGRKTYDSIGRALPGRQNIVITTNTGWNAPGCDVAHTIDEALTLANDCEEVMLIGGASLYEQTLKQADSLYLTMIDHSFEGDTWFPEIDFKAWQIESEIDFAADDKNPYLFTFKKLVCQNT